MNEYAVQMVPMLVMAGAVVAWMAQIPVTNRGYGFVADMMLAVAGSVAVGALVVWALSRDPGMIVMFWIGIVGAIAALAAQRRLWRPAAVARAR
jgi:uncharacterized membrane protein YeaQ/YmgE (transglycosylase-associated protein family)